jgi:type III secretory pathway component EscT
VVSLVSRSTTSGFRVDARPERRLLRGVPLSTLLIDELGRAGITPGAWLLATARVMPSMLLVPAFGLAALPLLARAGFALMLALSVAPALASEMSTASVTVDTLLAQIWLGLPVAVSAASALWVATMAGNLIDSLRGVQVLAAFSVVDSEASPLGVLLSLAASIGFLLLGGPAALLSALIRAQPLSQATLLGVALSVAQGIDVAVLLAAPLLAIAVVCELGSILIQRAAGASGLGGVLAPARSLVIVLFTAALLDRLVEGLKLWLDRQLGV